MANIELQWNTVYNDGAIHATEKHIVGLSGYESSAWFFHKPVESDHSHCKIFVFQLEGVGRLKTKIYTHTEVATDQWKGQLLESSADWAVFESDLCSSSSGKP